MTTRSAVRTRQTRAALQADVAPADNKENAKVNGVNAKARPKPRTANKAKVHCVCKKPDDGSPMICCTECVEWFHFHCIDLSERDAEDIAYYVCPSCHEKTGLRTVMEWEGADGPEEVSNTKRRYSLDEKLGVVPVEGVDRKQEEEEPASESSEDDSEDEYIAEGTRPKFIGKRAIRRVSDSSESDGDSIASPKGSKAQKRVRRPGGTSKDVAARIHPPSPGPSSLAKRRQSTSTQPPAKRKRSESNTTSGIDPARKYCLTKLQELFCPIFLRYPFFNIEGPHGGDIGGDLHPDKKEEDLSEDEKELLEGKAKRFAADLEQCMCDLYSEPDKTGKPTAAGRYKERFRMITFNLSQADRATLHMRVAASHIAPKELSTMSSTDLANEETKLSIKQAEQEALAHSILQKQALPRAKITHKGIQDIEDENGLVQREVEREREARDREAQEQERIERERLARLRIQTRRTASGQGSAPPDSPVVPHTPSWSAPPPVPGHSMQPHDLSSGLGRPPLNPLFLPSASDFGGPVEHELNLADLINIEEDSPQEGSPPAPTSLGDAPLSLMEDLGAGAQTSLTDSASASSTGISPFAAKPDTPSRQSFDLSSLWTPREDTGSEEHLQEKPLGPSYQDQEHRIEMDIVGEEADDQDFDMFLGKDDDEKGAGPVDNSPEAQREVFEALPRVWSGTLSMPLDSTMAQDFPVNARQMGGRPLGGDSLLWQTLFPSQQLRIDGRVPVEKSAQYLTQMRLSPAKELIAVAFGPAPGSGLETLGFKTLVDYLIAKGRHGLVFPWGTRPKEHAPGRELYIIPLLSTDAIPDYMELLDDLHLPRSRSSNYLVGIWVLNRGKLAPPPTPVGAPPSTPVFPSIDLSQFQHSTSIMNAFSPPQSSSAPAPQLPASLPPSVPATAPLAAEVAALTPEQIQLMLRALASSANPAPAMQPMPIPIQPWANTPLNYPPAPGYPPAAAGFPHQQAPPPPPSAYPMSYEHQDRQYSGPSFDRGTERGYRGRGGGRGGRGQPRDRGRDGGWKSRGRGRGGAASPPRDRGGRWGGERWS